MLTGLIDRRLLVNFDWALLALLLIIPACGLMVLYSAGFDPDNVVPIIKGLPYTASSRPFAKQLIFFVLATLVMISALVVPTNYYIRWAYPFYALCFLLLILVLTNGTVVNGSRRWLAFGSFNLQPVELMKLGLIFTLAKYLGAHPPKSGGYTLRELIIPALIFLGPMVLVIEQPDLGSALSLGAVGSLMILFMGVRFRSLAIIILTILVLAVPAWHKLHDYQQKRVLSLLNPTFDAQGSGYHIIQSKIAVGSGGVWGRGFLQGTQSQLEFLPEHTTDFIFSVLAEEWGFVGASFIILIYLFFTLKILSVVSREREVTASLLAFGVGSWLFFHFVVNVGMVIGLMPVVGIPLPLFSYGGSALFSAMFGVGVVLGVSMRRFQYLHRL